MACSEMEGSKQQNTTKELEMSQKEKTKQISTISFRSRDLEVMGLARFPCAIVLYDKDYPDYIHIA